MVAFRRRERPAPVDHEFAPSPRVAAARRDQRSLMDTVYEAGSLPVAAGDRETKLLASRLLVYGFLAIDEVGEDGATRRLRPSEAVAPAASAPGACRGPRAGSACRCRSRRWTGSCSRWRDGRPSAACALRAEIEPDRRADEATIGVKMSATVALISANASLASLQALAA